MACLTDGRQDGAHAAAAVCRPQLMGFDMNLALDSAYYTYSGAAAAAVAAAAAGRAISSGGGGSGGSSMSMSMASEERELVAAGGSSPTVSLELGVSDFSKGRWMCPPRVRARRRGLAS